MTSRNARLGLTEANGLLLAAYLVPAWALAVAKIAIHPVHGLFDRANLATTLYVIDRFQLVPSDVMRFAWLLALAKLLTIAFFIAFLVYSFRGRAARDTARELLGFALGLGGLIGFASLMLAARTGEASLIRLHASEALLIIGAIVVMLVEGGLRPRRLSAAHEHREGANAAPAG